MQSREAPARPLTRSGLQSATQRRNRPTTGYENSDAGGESIKRRLKETLRRLQVEGSATEALVEQWRRLKEQEGEVKSDNSALQRELKLLAKTLEECLNGRSLDAVGGDREPEKQERKRTIQTLKETVAQSKQHAILAMQRYEEERRKIWPRAASGQSRLFAMECEVLAEHQKELLRDKHQLQSTIRAKERAIEDDPLKQECYRILIDALGTTQSFHNESQPDPEVPSHFEEDIVATSNRILHLQKQIFCATKTEKQNRHQKQNPRRNEYEARDQEHIQEMQHSLEIFDGEKETCRQETYTLSENILSVLQNCMARQNLKDLVQKLGAGHDAERRNMVHARISELNELESEMQKVDVLEQKIRAELVSLDQEAQRILQAKEGQRCLQEELTATIRSLLDKEDVLTTQQSHLKEKLSSAEQACSEGNPEMISHLQSIYEQQMALGQCLKSLRNEDSDNEKADRARIAKENALRHLEELNQLLQASVIHQADMGK